MQKRTVDEEMEALAEDDVLQLTRGYEFEGEVVTSLDFSGFEDNVTMDDMIRAADLLARHGRVVINPEADLEYCLYIAACATHRPHEFFKLLKPRDAMRVKLKVRNLFFAGE